MFSSRSLLVASAAVAAFLCMDGLVVRAQDDNSVLRDVQMGMAGLMEASKNPEVLAQLMRDMRVRTCVCVLCTAVAATDHDNCICAQRLIVRSLCAWPFPYIVVLFLTFAPPPQFASIRTIPAPLLFFFAA
jgi:hypothetical protein